LKGAFIIVTRHKWQRLLEKPAQRYSKVSKPPNFLLFFFTLHYVFCQNAPILNDFCTKKGTFSVKVVIFASSKTQVYGTGKTKMEKFPFQYPTKKRN